MSSSDRILVNSEAKDEKELATSSPSTNISKRKVIIDDADENAIDLLESFLLKEPSIDETTTYQDPFAIENFILFASYFSAGFVLYYIGTPLSIYMVNTLNCSAAQQATVWTALSLPWGLKFLFGLTSDSFPILRYRRKPYFIFGWLTFLKCNVILVFLQKPSVLMLVILLFGMTSGLVTADVCTDALVVERSVIYGSHLQALGYTLRFLGGICGAILGAISLSSDFLNLSIAAVFFLNILIPFMLITPFLLIYGLHETIRDEELSLQEQLGVLWRMVQRDAVWKPCCFIFVYSNPAWTSFLIIGLKFDSFDLGVLSLSSAAFSYIALLLYKSYMTDFNWRSVYILTTIVSFVFTTVQILLITENTQLKNHLQQLCFALFTSGIVQFVTSVQFLPACKMFLAMCPEGSEGSSYAMLTTISNLAGTLSSSLSATLANVWDVSNDSLAAHQYQGLLKLTLLCGISQLCGLLFIGMLPANTNDQKYMQRCSSSSVIAGSVFVAVLASSLLFIVVNAAITLLELY